MQEPDDIHKPRTVADDLSGITVGRFVINAPVGAGGMGQVYRAEDSTLKRTVAVKRMAPHLRLSDLERQRFLKEAQRASALNHPNIASVHDVIEWGSELLLVMEFIDGTTLRQRLRGQPLTGSEFIQIAVQSAEGLVAAHQRGIVHGDIKPENIMITPSQRVKLLDFGVARRFASQANDATQTLVTMQGATSGTPAYMAPEVLQQMPYDGRADLFSLGLVFYEMLGGRQPFATDSFAGTLGRVLHIEPIPIKQLNPKVPDELAVIVSRLLKKDPEHRYESAEALLSDLQAFQHGKGPRASSEVGTTKNSRHRVAIASALAIATLILAAALLWSPVRQVLTRGMSNSTATTPATPKHAILAVLPFARVDDNPQLTALGQGLVQSVAVKLDRLTEERALEVIPAVNAQEKGVTSAADAWKQFGATIALSVNLGQSADLMRLSYSLLDTRTGRILGGNSITVPATDVFAVEDDVAQGTISALGLTLRPEEQTALKMHGTSLPGAYNHYLQARGYLLNFSSPENVDNAIVLVQQALKLDPNFGMAKAALGEAYWRKYWHTKQKKWTQLARTECNSAVTLGNSGSAGHICLGLVHDGTGQYAEAANEYQRAIELEPTNESAHIGLALAFERQGKIEKAEQTYRATMEHHSQSWIAHNALGGFYYRRADYEKAAETFKRVTELAPEGFAGYINLAATYNTSSRYREAIEPLQRSLALRPTYAVYMNLGNAYFGLREFDQAAAAYEQATKISPKQYATWGNLGEAHYYAGTKENATRAYSKAIELANEELKVNPRSAEVLSDLANYFAMINDREQALHHLQSALQYGRSDKQVYVVAASVYNQLGETGLALEWLTKSVQAGYSRTIILGAPAFQNLKGNPRYEALMSSTGPRNP